MVLKIEKTEFSTLLSYPCSNFSHIISLKRSTLFAFCREDYEYTRETFPWKRHTRDPCQGNRRTMSSGSKNVVSGSSCDSRYFPDHQYSSKSNDKDIRDITNKVISYLKQNCNFVIYLDLK